MEKLRPNGSKVKKLEGEYATQNARRVTGNKRWQSKGEKPDAVKKTDKPDLRGVPARTGNGKCKTSLS